MNKNVIINYDEEQNSNWPLSAKYAIEQLINAWEDFAYGYDMNDEAVDAICDVLQEVGIDYNIEVEDV